MNTGELCFHEQSITTSPDWMVLILSDARRISSLEGFNTKDLGLMARGLIREAIRILSIFDDVHLRGSSWCR